LYISGVLSAKYDSIASSMVHRIYKTVFVQLPSGKYANLKPYTLK